VFESSVDRFGGSVAGAGSVEVGEHVEVALLQGAAEGDQFVQRLRHPDHLHAVEAVRVVDQRALASARTALLALFQETPSPSATRATVRCCTTKPSSAHRSPRRDSLPADPRPSWCLAARRGRIRCSGSGGR
jgi:hypothetical protein